VAAITRFVNTASTAGSQDGTTNTPGNSGTAAYESLAAWNTAEAADLTAGGDQHTVEFDGSGGAETTTAEIVISGWVTDSGDFLTFNGNRTGHTYREVSDGNGYRLEFTVPSNYDNAIGNAESYSVYNDFQIKITSAFTQSVAYKATSGGQFIDYNRCIARGVFTASGGGAQAGGFVSQTADGGHIYACLAYDFTLNDNAGFRGIVNDNTYDWLNCTARNCDRSYARDHSSTAIRNCVSQYHVTVGFGGTIGYAAVTSHNASDEDVSTIPGTSPQSGEVTFVDEDNDDFQLASGDTVAKDNGVDLSGTFDFDLANNAMPATWPIGCMQAAAAAGLPPRNLSTLQSVARMGHY